ncbi:MAG: hypothetical protein AB7P02_22805 [Alphaproteobacteria bacterium]
MDTVEVVARPKPMNTRMGDEPDVAAIDHPLVNESRALLERLGRRELTVEAYQAEVVRLHDRLDLPRLLRPYVEMALAGETPILYRRTFPGGREAIQLFAIAAGEVHPPHAHHNIVSTQMVVSGLIRCREYDRVARLGPDTVLLRRRFDGWMETGQSMHTTELERNVHWFAADEAPAVVLNFSAYGYQDWTFDPKDRPLRRGLIDPTAGTTPDGYLVGREVGPDVAYTKFAGVPIDAFVEP